jgi:hypothetical protein
MSGCTLGANPDQRCSTGAYYSKLTKLLQQADQEGDVGSGPSHGLQQLAAFLRGYPLTNRAPVEEDPGGVVRVEVIAGRSHQDAQLGSDRLRALQLRGVEPGNG